jgi:hypothetical protein
MWKRDPRPVMVMDEGKCKCQFIGEAKCNEFDGVQEPLSDAMRMLLCLIDGAEHRQNLSRRWSGQAPGRPDHSALKFPRLARRAQSHASLIPSLIEALRCYI